MRAQGKGEYFECEFVLYTNKHETYVPYRTQYRIKTGKLIHTRTVFIK